MCVIVNVKVTKLPCNNMLLKQKAIIQLKQMYDIQ